MNYQRLTTPELKHLRKHTMSFAVLREVEAELLKRKAIRKSSFAFIKDWGLNTKFEN